MVYRAPPAHRHNGCGVSFICSWACQSLYPGKRRAPHFLYVATIPFGAWELTTFIMNSSTIHRKLIQNSVDAIESLIIRKSNDVSEEDIRTVFLNSNTAPRTISIQKEQEGKTDIVIRDKNTNQLLIRYELKTYIKDNETIHDQIDRIINDFQKLHTHRGDEVCYFILVCRREKLEDRAKKNANRIEGQMDFIYQYPNLNVNARIMINNNLEARIAYSVRDRERFVIYSWKVM